MQPIITTKCQRCGRRTRVTRRQYRFCYECSQCIYDTIREILQHAKEVGVIRNLFTENTRQ